MKSKIVLVLLSLMSAGVQAGVIKGKTPAFKKAIITLKEGESIDFFSNI